MNAALQSSPRLSRKTSSLPAALTSVLKTLGLEEEDPEDVFEIHSKEGAGAFGRVFRASYRREPTRLAALKVIPVALEAGQRGEDIENVRREIEFLRACDHPNVVAFFGAYYKDQALWVAMEYCGGGSVGDVSRRRKLNEEEIAVITRGALHGLAYLHSRKKIHRDIKGGNILLTSDGLVKIADFGVSAQLKDTLSRRGTFVGTPYWMSPEMIQDSDYDYKSDIWSLGITIIELADQRPPLFDEHPMRVLIQIPRNPPPTVKSPQLWTPLFLQFLQFCLRKDPQQRPGAVECLDHAFIQRVAAVSCVYAEGADARRAAVEQQRADQKQLDEDESRREESVVAAVAAATVDGSTRDQADSEATADDVTLKASVVRPPKPPARTSVQPALVVADGANTDAAGESGTLEPVVENAAAADDGGGVGTPRDSVVDEFGDLSRSAGVTSSRSSCSDDDAADGIDATAEGFAFRSPPPPTSSPPSTPPEAAATAHHATVSGGELLQLSVDDPFEMPATALLSKFHAAASTLAGQSLRPRPVGSGAPHSVRSALPVPLQSAPSPNLRGGGKRASIDPGRALQGDATASFSSRRELRSFARSDSLLQRSPTAIHQQLSSSPHGTPSSPQPSSSDSASGWRNPLAELTSVSHDRVNSLLSSISASTSRLALQAQLPAPLGVDSSMEWTPPLHQSSLGGSRLLANRSPSASMRSTSIGSNSSGSSSHFIGAPFRVAHHLNVHYNTLEAKFEGVPSCGEWAAVHKQFGIPLAQMRCRSRGGGSLANDQRHAVPALALMLHRELVQRDGLACKFVYRVSPDQSEIQRAKLAINSGAFDASGVCDPHVFASLLKHWLRELPTPLLAAITRADLASAVQTLVKESGEGKDSELEFALTFAETHAYISTTLLAKLPAAECGVLLWLADHMLEVVAQSVVNGMTAHSLAVVMAPNVYRWASTTPADASWISHQVATLLRALLAWRQRSHEGVMTAAKEHLHASQSILTGRPRGSRADAASAYTITNSSKASSASGSLRGSLPRDSTVSSILRRSSVVDASHFVSASDPLGLLATGETLEPNDLKARVASLDQLLRDCADALWSELPLSLMLDDHPPIMRSLQKTFHAQVFSLLQQHAQRGDDRRWAAQNLLQQQQHAPLQTTQDSIQIPMSLRKYKRWIHAALTLDAFTTLLKQQRHARSQLDKLAPSGASTTPQELTSAHLSYMQSILALGSGSDHAHDEPADVQFSLAAQQALLDGAATLLAIARSAQAGYGVGPTATLPLAEDLERMGENEPLLGNVLAWLSGHYTRRYHLDKPHDLLVAKVERLVKEGLR